MALGVALPVVLGIQPPLHGGDWPQILGPARNGVAVDEMAPEKLPSTLRTLWTVPVGQGYAGPAVVHQTVLIFHRLNDKDRLQAIDRANGRTRWQHDFDANYRGGVDPDTGPRCVPLVAHNTVIAYGADGVVHAVGLADGELRWQRDLVQDFDGSDGYFGTGTTPIAVGNRLLINAGGRDGAGLIALDLETGKTLWKSGDEAASYASPTLVTGTGEPRVLFVTRRNALLVDPANGKVIARHPFGRSGPTVNAATPLVFGQYAFLTASYRVGAVLLRIEDDQWDTVWSNDDTLSSQYNTPVFADGFLYGIHGREDMGPVELRCVEAVTGRIAWRQPQFGVAHLLRVADRLLILKVDGTLLMAEVNSREFQKISQLQVSTAATRALPALSDGQLFIRENSGRTGHLLCIELSPPR